MGEREKIDAEARELISRGREMRLHAAGTSWPWLSRTAGRFVERIAQWCKRENIRAQLED